MPDLSTDALLEEYIKRRISSRLGGDMGGGLDLPEPEDYLKVGANTTQDDIPNPIPDKHENFLTKLVEPLQPVLTPLKAITNVPGALTGLAAGALMPDAYKRAREANTRDKGYIGESIAERPGAGQTFLEALLPGEGGPWRNAAKTVGGLVGDIATDPQTYIPVGGEEAAAVKAGKKLGPIKGLLEKGIQAIGEKSPFASKAIRQLGSPLVAAPYLPEALAGTAGGLQSAYERVKEGDISGGLAGGVEAGTQGVLAALMARGLAHEAGGLRDRAKSRNVSEVVPGQEIAPEGSQAPSEASLKLAPETENTAEPKPEGYGEVPPSDYSLEDEQLSPTFPPDALEVTLPKDEGEAFELAPTEEPQPVDLTKTQPFVDTSTQAVDKTQLPTNPGLEPRIPSEVIPPPVDQPRTPLKGIDGPVVDVEAKPLVETPSTEAVPAPTKEETIADLSQQINESLATPEPPVATAPEGDTGLSREQMFEKYQKQAEAQGKARAARSRMDPKEAVQESYVRLLEAIDKYDPSKGPLENYLATTLAGKLQAAAKKTARGGLTGEGDRVSTRQMPEMRGSEGTQEKENTGNTNLSPNEKPEASGIPGDVTHATQEEDAVNKEVREKINKFVSMLPDDEKALYNQFYSQGKTAKELAAAYKVTEARIRQRIEATNQKVREHLGVEQKEKATKEKLVLSQEATGNPKDHLERTNSEAEAIDSMQGSGDRKALLAYGEEKGAKVNSKMKTAELADKLRLHLGLEGKNKVTRRVQKPTPKVENPLEVTTSTGKKLTITPAERAAALAKLEKGSKRKAMVDPLGFQAAHDLVGDLSGKLPQAKEALLHSWELVHRGIKEAGAWTGRMVAKLGNAVKPILRDLFNFSVKGHAYTLEGAAGHVAEHVGSLVNTKLQGLFRRAKPVLEGRARRIEAKGRNEKAEAAVMQRDPGEGPLASLPKNSQRRPHSLAPLRKLMGITESSINTFTHGSLNKEEKADLVAVARALERDKKLSRSVRKTLEDLNMEVDEVLAKHSPDELVDMISQRGGSRNAIELTAMKRLLNSATETVQTAKKNLLQAAADGKDTADSTVDLMKALGKMSFVTQQFSNDKTRLARGMAFMRWADGKAVARSATERFQEALRGASYTSKQIEDLTTIFEDVKSGKGKLEELQRALSYQGKRKMIDNILYFYKAGLLGPTSLAANMTSNMVFHNVRGLEDKLASGMDWARHKVTGAERERYMLPTALTHSYMKKAYGEGIKQFLKDHVKIFQLKNLLEGMDEKELMTRLEGSAGDLDINKFSSGPVGGKAGEFFNAVFKSLESGDDMFKNMSMYREIYHEAYKRSVKLGDKDILERTEKLVKELLDARDPESTKFIEHKGLWENVYKEMKRNTLQADLKGILAGVQRLTDDHKSLQFLVPFRRTPSNIALETIRRTPMGLYLAARDYGALGGKNKLGSIGNLEREIAKPLVGSTIMALTYGLAMTGGLTGGGPSDPEKEAALKRTGWQPYSAKIGNQYISFSRMEPISSLLGIAADAAEGVKNGDLETGSKAFQKMWGSIMENLTSKTFLSGLEGFFSAWHDPVRYGPRWIKQLQSSAVPSMVGLVPLGAAAKAVDPVYRKTEAFTLSPLQAKIPFASKSLPAQLEPTGEERQRGGGTALERLVSPLARSEEKRDPLAKVSEEMVKVGYVPSLPRTYMTPGNRKVQLNEKEIQILTKAQVAASNAIAKVLNDPSYKELPDNEDDPKLSRLGQTTKKDVLKGIYNRYRKQAQAQINPVVFRRAQQELAGR